MHSYARWHKDNKTQPEILKLRSCNEQQTCIKTFLFGYGLMWISKCFWSIIPSCTSRNDDSWMSWRIRRYIPLKCYHLHINLCRVALQKVKILTDIQISNSAWIIYTFKIFYVQRSEYVSPTRTSKRSKYPGKRVRDKA